MTVKNNRCIDCRKLIGKYSKRCYSCASKYRLTVLHPQNGKNNFNYKTGIKFKIFCCIDCGVKISQWSGIYGDHRCSNCNYKFHTGENHHNYMDGKGNFPYSLEFNEELKLKIRNRDNYRCQKCSVTEEEHLIVYGIKLSVHHIDYNKENNEEENLITLCNECNLRVNYNRDYWTNYFEEKISVIRKDN